MTRRLFIVLIGVLAFLAAAAVLSRRGPAAIDVDVEVVATRDLIRSIVSASGEIVPTRYADIGSSVMGRIVELRVKEGDAVRAGQTVARIDPVQARGEAAAAEAQVRAARSEHRAALQQVKAAEAAVAGARARAVEAQRNLERARALVSQQVLAAAELDAMRASADAADATLTASQADLGRARSALSAAARRIEQATAQRTQAEDLLSKTDIVAPMTGVVTRLNVREGEMVVIGIQNQPGTTLLTIADLAALNAEVKVAEADVLRLATGQPATLTLDASPGNILTGEVIEIGASALPQAGAQAAAREFRAVIRLHDRQPTLRPGLTCDVEIVTAERTNALAVPLQAVVLRPDEGAERPGVFVVDDGHARFEPVTTGIIGGLDIEIAGVPAGTPVVVGPYQVLRELRDGARVRRLDRSER